MKYPVPKFTWAYGAGRSVVSFSGKHDEPRTVTLAPGKTLEILVPADSTRMPRRSQLDMAVSVGHLDASHPGESQLLESLSEVR